MGLVVVGGAACGQVSTHFLIVPKTVTQGVQAGSQSATAYVHMWLKADRNERRTRMLPSQLPTSEEPRWAAG